MSNLLGFLLLLRLEPTEELSDELPQSEETRSWNDNRSYRPARPSPPSPSPKQKTGIAYTPPQSALDELLSGARRLRDAGEISEDEYEELVRIALYKNDG